MYADHTCVSRLRTNKNPLSHASRVSSKNPFSCSEHMSTNERHEATSMQNPDNTSITFIAKILWKSKTFFFLNTILTFLLFAGGCVSYLTVEAHTARRPSTIVCTYRSDVYLSDVSFTMYSTMHELANTRLPARKRRYTLTEHFLTLRVFARFAARTDLFLR